MNKKDYQELANHYRDNLEEVEKERDALLKDLNNYKHFEETNKKLYYIYDNLSNINIGLWLWGLTWLVIEVGKLRGWW